MYENTCYTIVEYFNGYLSCWITWRPSELLFDGAEPQYGHLASLTTELQSPKQSWPVGSQSGSSLYGLPL